MLSARIQRNRGIVILTITICIMSIPAYAQYSGGTGEPNNPYQIATAQDLIDLGNESNDYDKHFIMTADIDLRYRLNNPLDTDNKNVVSWIQEFSLGIFC